MRYAVYIVWLSHKHGDWEAVVYPWILPLARNERRQQKVMVKVFSDFLLRSSKFFFYFFVSYAPRWQNYKISDIMGIFYSARYEAGTVQTEYARNSIELPVKHLVNFNIQNIYFIVFSLF